MNGRPQNDQGPGPLMWVAAGISVVSGAIGGFVGGPRAIVWSAVAALVASCLIFYLIGLYIMKSSNTNQAGVVSRFGSGTAAIENREVILSELLKTISKQGFSEIGFVATFCHLSMKLPEDEAIFMASTTIMYKEKFTGEEQKQAIGLLSGSVAWCNEIGPDAMRRAAEYTRKLEQKYGVEAL